MESDSHRWRRTKSAILIAFSLLIVAIIVGRNKIKEEAAYVLGMETYVYGYPLVVMDVSRQVLTAAPAPNQDGTAAPINQLAKMPHYVSSLFH